MKAEKTIILALLLCLPVAASAQRDKPDNLPHFDNKWIHFGFQLGLSQNGFGLDHDLSRTDSLIKLEVARQPGFVIHILSELHMGPYFGLRLTPGISFASRNLEYTFYGQAVPKVRTVESTFVEAPLMLKYRSKRVNNFAQYVMLGGSYNFDLASQQNADNTVDKTGELIVKIKPQNYNLEIGVGFDFFLEYFKFSPELRFSYGMNNIISQENTIYSAPIIDLRSRIFIFALNFEG